MIIDLEKMANNTRYNAHRAYLISAGYRTHKDGAWEKWMDTRDNYAVVTASSPYAALREYLAKRPDKQKEIVDQWVFTDAMQRVFLVRRFDDVGRKLDTNQTPKATNTDGVHYIFG